MHLDGQRIKASRTVKLGDIYDIQRGYNRLTVVVDGLSGRRGPAAVAQTLYHETEQSIQKRARENEQRKLARLSRPTIDHRPNKRERRKLRSFTGKD